MNKRLIVNIRGANASGKTTLMRHFMENVVNSLELRSPDNTRVDFQFAHAPGSLNMPLCIIGKYDASKYSGCDKIKSADAIEWAVKHAMEAYPAHHVMFEGFRVSKSYSRFAALRNELTRQYDVRWVWAFLHASHDLICARSEARREDTSRPIDKVELGRVVKQMTKTKRTVEQLWHEDAVTLDPNDSPDEVYHRLVVALQTMELS